MAGACILAGYLRRICRDKPHYGICLLTLFNHRELIVGDLRVVRLVPGNAALGSYDVDRGCEGVAQPTPTSSVMMRGSLMCFVNIAAGFIWHLRGRGLTG